MSDVFVRRLKGKRIDGIYGVFIRGVSPYWNVGFDATDAARLQRAFISFGVEGPPCARTESVYLTRGDTHWQVTTRCGGSIEPWRRDV